MKAKRLRLYLLILLIAGASLTSCRRPGEERVNQRIRLATTTSTENSGLLDLLLPPFEKKFKVKVDVIAVGTGKALKLGERGDVDVVFVHCPEAEDKFVHDGFGVNQREVMFNDFVIVGAKGDPAKIKGSNALRALKKVAGKGCYFTSRADESGTHKKEKELWRLAKLAPQGAWYLQTGQGMGATLQIANEKRAYCLVDRGTYITYKKKIDLVILSQGDQKLFNPYSIIAVNPQRHPYVNYVYALALIGWVTSPEGQRIISKYQKDGEVLFHPLEKTKVRRKK